MFTTKAFSIFRSYISTTKKYQNIDIEIVDETLIVEDLITTIEKAKVSTLAEINETGKDNPTYTYGFFNGFLLGNLNEHWYNEYIRKQSEMYKHFILLKAIKGYLQLHTISVIHIQAIFMALLKKDLNATIDKGAPSRIISPEIEALELEEERGTQMVIFDLIENQIDEYVKAILKFETPQLLDKINDCFNVEEVQFLMQNDVSQFR